MRTSDAKAKPVERLAYSPAEFAAAIGSSVSFIRLELSRGKLPSVKRGRKRLIPAAAAREYAGADLK